MLAPITIRFSSSHGLGRNLPEACQRMDRALREFRIRGVKTNIPFVEIVNTEVSRRRTHDSFLDEFPKLFHFPSRGDRALSCFPISAMSS